MCISFFYKIFVWDISYSKRDWTRYDNKCILASYKALVIRVRLLWKLNFLNKSFEK